jgi:hypothetical protein
MPSPNSLSLPGLAGGIEPVIGEAIIDTGLREVQSFVASMNINNFVPNAESKVGWYFLPKDTRITQRVVLRVEKGGDNDGVLGTNEIQVSWIAMGE